jgi:DNA processing protein
MKDPRHWLALVRTPNLSWTTLEAMLAEFGTPEALFSLKPRQLSPFELHPRTRETLLAPDWDRIDSDAEWLISCGAQLVPITSPEYPALLRDTRDAPLALFARGNTALLGEYQLAMVGSRNPTSGGATTARDFARELGSAGLVITSGLALGIDAACHAAALDTVGGTIAVCGTGLDRLYPAGNRELAERIVEKGLMISEFPPGTHPRPENFPRRNRIISGLSLGTLVVEAAYRSGSLITARLASEQGREVFAIPGSIHNPLARGCHRLIRDGAKLVESASDVLEELGPLLGSMTAKAGEPAGTPARLQAEMAQPHETQQQEDDSEYRALLEKVGFDPTPVDVIVERTGMSANAVSSMLLILELRGKVEATPGGRYARTTE